MKKVDLKELPTIWQIILKRNPNSAPAKFIKNFLKAYGLRIK